MSQGAIDWTAPHNGTETSHAAADSMRASATYLHGRILERLAVTPEGLTCDCLEQLLGLTHQTCSPRVWELLRRGAIFHFGKRETRSGRKARVYFISSAAKKNA